MTQGTFYKQVVQELLARLEQPIYGVKSTKGGVKFLVKIPSLGLTKVDIFLGLKPTYCYISLQPAWSSRILDLPSGDCPDLFAKVQEILPALTAQAKSWEAQRLEDYWRSNNSLWHRLKYFYWDLRNHYRG